MTKLNQREREMFYLIVEQDLKAIHKKMQEQIRNMWTAARDELLKELGHDKIIQRKLYLEDEKARIINEIHQLEGQLKSKKMTAKEALEFGGAPNKYGHIQGANFYDVPIESSFEYKVAKLIQANVDLEAPAKFVHDLGKACIREITMAGTFEDAQRVYEKFYALDFQKYGIDIPPRLDDIKTRNPLPNTPERLQLPKVPKRIEEKKKGAEERLSTDTPDYLG